MSNAPGRKRLTRDLDNRMIGGVCAGIANYFDIDPTLVRVLFVALTVTGGSGLLVYLLLWIVIPGERGGGHSEPSSGPSSSAGSGASGHEAQRPPDAGGSPTNESTADVARRTAEEIAVAAREAAERVAESARRATTQITASARRQPGSAEAPGTTPEGEAAGATQGGLPRPQDVAPPPGMQRNEPAVADPGTPTNQPASGGQPPAESPGTAPEQPSPASTPPPPGTLRNEPAVSDPGTEGEDRDTEGGIRP